MSSLRRSADTESSSRSASEPLLRRLEPNSGRLEHAVALQRVVPFDRHGVDPGRSNEGSRSPASSRTMDRDLGPLHLPNGGFGLAGG